MQQQWRRRSGKRKDRMKLSLPPKLLEKLVWIPETQFTTKIAGKTSLGPSYFVFLQKISFASTF